jgi:signal transduction histidine kinase
MTPSQLKNICEPFFSSKQKEGGMGLGLYVSQSIVKEHGGELHITSAEGKGTKVSLVLPVSVAEPVRSSKSVRPA